MRDPKRIDRILKKLSILWGRYPDMRFCQLISNLTKHSKIFYNLEDDDFIKLIEKPIWEGG